MAGDQSNSTGAGAPANSVPQNAQNQGRILLIINVCARTLTAHVRFQGAVKIKICNQCFGSSARILMI